MHLSFFCIHLSWIRGLEVEEMYEKRNNKGLLPIACALYYGYVSSAVDAISLQTHSTRG